MKGKFRRRGAMLSLAASLSVGGLILGIGAAEAAAAPISVSSPSGVYSSPNVSSGKVGVPDLAPGDSIIANCWNRGQNLGIGNVWYHTEVERYTTADRNCSSLDGPTGDSSTATRRSTREPSRPADKIQPRTAERRAPGTTRGPARL